MRLLLASLPRIQRLIPSVDTLVTALFVAVVVGLELFSSFAKSDLYDLLAAMVLTLALAMLIDRHRRYPIAWLTWLTRRIQALSRFFRRYNFKLGIDLRGTPTLPTRTPPIIWLMLALLLTFFVVAGVVNHVLPGGWRELGLRSLYTPYLALIMALWVGLLVTVLGAFYVGHQLLDAILPQQWNTRDRRSLEAILLMTAGIVVSSLAMIVPVVAAFTLTAAMLLLGVVMTWKLGRPEPGLLWRGASSQAIYFIPMRQAATAFCLFVSLGLLALLYAASAGRMLTPPDVNDPMIITVMLGTLTAWMSPVLALGLLALLFVQWSEDPARPRPLELELSAHPESSYVENINQALKILRGWGWSVRQVTLPEPKSLGLHLVPADLSEALEFQPDWPLKVSLDDLQDGEVKDRFLRKDEIQLRRQAMRGVSTLFKRAFAERRSRGGGYWFAPQWTFYSALHRDPPDRNSADEPGPIGSNYSAVFSPRARHYLYRVLRAVQVDSIFVEDGVNQRTVVKVLRQLCDVFDRHAGQRRAEEMHFKNIPKVRVILHEYAPGQRLEVSGYREPKFDELDRARVLHIFRDQGGEEAETRDPFDFSWEPSPALFV